MRITYFKDAFRRPLHTDPKTFFHPNTQLQAKFFEPNDVSNLSHVLLHGHYFFMEIVYIFSIGLTFLSTQTESEKSFLNKVSNLS